MDNEFGDLIIFHFPLKKAVRFGNLTALTFQKIQIFKFP